MFGNREHSQWVERYRPDTLDGYVGNESIVSKVKVYLQSGDVPHLLLYGVAGTGKTTLAKIIANGIDCDLMYLNASDERGIDTIREKVKTFASTVGFQDWKLIILDESDYLTPDAQASLRNLMETFSKTTRFILTCNYVEKVIDPIQSRCQVFGVHPPSKAEVAKRLADILAQEEVTFDMPDLATIVNGGYPDIRRVLNGAQRHVIDGKLVLDEQSVIESGYTSKVIDELKSNSVPKDKLTTIRQLIADSKVRTFEPLYQHLFDDIDDWGAGHIGPCLLVLAESQYKDSLVVNKELNVSAMMIQLITELGK